MVAKSQRKSRVSPRWQGGVAGASTGTSLLVLLNLLPDKSLLKPILTYLSPSITIVTSLAWAYTTSAFKDWLNDKRIAAEREKIKQLVHQVELDPQSSEEHKKAVRKESEKVELTLIEIHTERIEAIRAIDKF
jgi:hypothetical protein